MLHPPTGKDLVGVIYNLKETFPIDGTRSVAHRAVGCRLERKLPDETKIQGTIVAYSPSRHKFMVELDNGISKWKNGKKLLENGFYPIDSSPLCVACARPGHPSNLLVRRSRLSSSES